MLSLQTCKRRINSKIIKMKKLGISALLKGVCLVVVAVAAVSCGGKQDQQQAQGVQVATLKVELGNATLHDEYPVTIKGKADIEIRPQVSGFITKVLVDEGQTVRKDQALFEIDKVQYEAAVRSAESAVAAAKTQVSTARLTADNKQKLFEKNIISSYENQTAQLSLQAAEAAFNQANAMLINARKSLSYATVTSPSNGVVGNIPYRLGALVSPSTPQPLTTVSDNSEVYAYFSIDEKKILELTNNGERTLNEAVKAMPEVSLILANGQPYAQKGTVSTVSGVLDLATGSSTVRAMFNNTNGMLHSGSTGKVQIPLDVNNVILVPQKATYEIQNMKYVYILDAEGVAKSQIIKVNQITDGKMYVVTDGLKPGDVIAVEGVGTKVRDGVKVIPAQPAQAAQPAEQK